MPSRSSTTHRSCTSISHLRIWRHAAQQAGFEAPHYRIDGPHRLVSTAGIHPWQLPESMVKPVERICRAGLFGPWDPVDLGVEKLPAGVNPAGCDPWGLDSFQLFPNWTILIWGQGWYLTYHYWPTSFNSHTFEGTLYMIPAKTPRERIQHELMACPSKSSDCKTPTLWRRPRRRWSRELSPSFRSATKKSSADICITRSARWIEDYRTAKASGLTSCRGCPNSSQTWSRSPTSGVLPTEPERQAKRLGSTMARHHRVLRHRHATFRDSDDLAGSVPAGRIAARRCSTSCICCSHCARYPSPSNAGISRTSLISDPYGSISSRRLRHDGARSSFAPSAGGTRRPTAVQVAGSYRREGQPDHVRGRRRGARRGLVPSTSVMSRCCPD